MKRIFDIIFVLIVIFLLAFIVLNNKLILDTYDFSLFGFEFSGKIILYGIILFLIYSLVNWIFVRFVFVFGGSKENKLNEKIRKLQEEINVNQTELRTDIIKEIKSSFDTTISNYEKNNKEFLEEKLEKIDGELGRINALLGYLKKDEK